MTLRSKTILKLLSRMVTLLAVLLLIGAVYFQSTAYPPLDEVSSLLESHPDVSLARDRISFMSEQNITDVGLIIYPGGNVDFRAYAPFAARISAEGYPVFIQKMPLNLAVFGINHGLHIIRDHPEIQQWVLAGHSLGGAMGARFVLNHPDAFSGIVFLASYPDVDLRTTSLEVISLYGDRDGIINRQRLDSSLLLLPADAEVREIPGANHAGFGHYGPQRGDQDAVITREEQQNMTATTIVQLLDRLGASP